MGERAFTKHFKNALGQHFRDLVEDDDFSVGVEKDLPRQVLGWQGRPDIWVAHQRRPYMLIVEIEHVSSDRQALKNVIQAAEWAQDHRHARVSFLHLLTKKSAVLPDVHRFLSEIRDKDISGFMYRVVYYSPTRGDETLFQETADAILDDPPFQRALKELWKWVNSGRAA